MTGQHPWPPKGAVFLSPLMAVFRLQAGFSTGFTRPPLQFSYFPNPEECGILR